MHYIFLHAECNQACVCDSAQTLREISGIVDKVIARGMALMRNLYYRLLFYMVTEGPAKGGW
jgi:hypothetical protein